MTGGSDENGWPPSELSDALELIASCAAEHDADGSFAFEAFERLLPTGALRWTIPVEHGGLGEGLASTARLIVAVGEADPSVALLLSQHLMLHALAGDDWPHDVLAVVRKSSVDGVAPINVLRVEPDLGTPARGGLPATIAERLPDGLGWRISGHKIYATGIPLLRWLLVWARTDDTVPAAGSFLVEAGTPRYRVERTWESLGMRATRSDDVVFEGVEVPLEHAIGLSTEPAGLPPVGMAWNGLMIAAIYHGVARAARDWLVGYLNERTPSNLGAPLASLPRFQEAVGRVEALVASGDVLIDSTAAAVDAGRDPAAAARSSLVKHTVTNQAVDVVLEAVKLTGNPGLLRVNPLERHLRDVLHGRIHTPQDDTILVGAGRSALDAAVGRARGRR